MPAARLRSRPAKSPSSDDVVRELIALIGAKGLRSGDRLPSIRQLATTMQAPPNVVRDALMQAQTLGVVRIAPRSGAFVQAATFAPLVEALSQTLGPALAEVDDNLFHLLETRRLVELDTVAKAAARRRTEDLLPLRDALETMLAHIGSPERDDFVQADMKFHLAIAGMAGNPVLTSVLRSVLDLVHPYLMRLSWGDARREFAERSHTEIYQALLDGNVAAARETMEEHLDVAYQTLISRVRNVPIISEAARADVLRSSAPTRTSDGETARLEAPR